jgi:hypothetical protein
VAKGFPDEDATKICHSNDKNTGHPELLDEELGMELMESMIEDQ